MGRSMRRTGGEWFTRFCKTMVMIFVFVSHCSSSFRIMSLDAKSFHTCVTSIELFSLPLNERSADVMRFFPLLRSLLLFCCWNRNIRSPVLLRREEKRGRDGCLLPFEMSSRKLPGTRCRGSRNWEKDRQQIHLSIMQQSGNDGRHTAWNQSFCSAWLHNYGFCCCLSLQKLLPSSSKAVSLWKSQEDAAASEL